MEITVILVTLLVIIGIVIFALFITVVTMIPVALIGWLIYRRFHEASAMRQASQNWAETTGRVLKSRVEVSGGNIASVSPHVVYEYTVAGMTYQGDQVRVGDNAVAVRTDSEAYQIVDRYPVGAEVTVYYDPANPAMSALER